MSLRITKGALTLGLEEVKKTWLSEEHDFRVVLRDTKGNEKVALGHAHELINSGADILFGSPDSPSLIPTALLTGFLNLPHITWVGATPELGDKILYNTLVRTIGPFGNIGPALVTIFRKYGWTRVGLFYPETGFRTYAVGGLKDAFAQYKLKISDIIIFTGGTPDEETIVSGLARLRTNSRIIFLSVGTRTKRVILRKALEMGMCDGEYVFILPNSLEPIGEYKPWYTGDDELDAITKRAFKCVYDLCMATGTQDTNFRDMVAQQNAEAPFFDDWMITNNASVSRFAQYLYDAAVVYGMWLNHSLSENVDPRDGRGLFTFTKNISFIGQSGLVKFDSNGDRLPSYKVHCFNTHDGIGQLVGQIDTFDAINESYREYAPFKWLTSDGKPPPDVPPCGFHGEFCIEPSDSTDTIIFAVVPTVVVLSVLACWFEWRRRKKIEEVMKGAAWRIDMSRLTQVGVTIRNTCMSIGSLDASAHMSNTDGSVLGMGNVALYQNIYVFCKEITTDKLILNREVLFDLKSMKEMSHENINTFVGAALVGPKVNLLFKFCKKYSLQDILQNDSIQLDWMFKFSFISDIVEGMCYLQNTRIKSHGQLTSSNCLIDDRWVLKITDYGIGHFRSAKVDTSQNQRPNQQLWTAPELLRLFIMPNRGSQAGDVYSFGIILNEIYYRKEAFFVSGMDASEIIKRVKKLESPPFRPPKGTRPDIPKSMTQLLDNCLEEDPSLRPSFGNIRKYIRIHNKDQLVGIMDMMVKKLEKYANNLEDIVSQRTIALIDEKKKTDALLNRMLPPSISDKLKRGEPIEPEYFDHVTIFFSDIVGFTVISAKSQPVEIVNLLNDLYTMFDEIIDTYDAYKVETIGDAYMVCSGLPVRNGMLHATNIAAMSLDILSCVSSFKIRHMPTEKLRIRIGFHTGPCCAGVVGLATPKYCLFGDTVNTASRMESHGESMQVHISGAAKNAVEFLGGFEVRERGEIQIKGKGLMRTFWLLSKSE